MNIFYTEFHIVAENIYPKVIHVLWCKTVDDRHVEFGFAANYDWLRIKFLSIFNIKQQI